MSMGRAYFGRRKNGMEPLAGTAQFLEQVFNRYENLEIEQEGVFMGYFFSEPVERALKYIYYEMGSGRGQEGFRLLEQAAEEGDADACCLLARCLYGPEYTWPGHHFPIDERRGDELVRRSVLGGSAIGVLISMRCGVMDGSLKQSMPFGSLQEAFDVVLDKAERGEPFCQMLIGNVYFWGDFLDIQNKSQADFDGDDAFQSFLRENVAKCEDWLWKAFRGGISTGGGNLAAFYRDGKQGLLLPRPEMEREVDRYGAEKGYPDFLCYYADDLYMEGQKAEAFELYRKSAQMGEPRSFFRAGYSYELGEGVEQDYQRAADYYQRALDAPIYGKVGSANRLGSLYYEGQGVPQDYAKAYQLLKWAYDQNPSNNWGAYYLGACYAYGRGTQQDYVLARKFLEMVDWNSRTASYLLGYLYARGLGGPEDIAKGVEYLQKAGDYAEAKEELKHYKKTLFGGKWVRR